MKITIDLQPNEIEGIKQYLINRCDKPKPTKADIKIEINGIIQEALQSPKCAYSDYIV